MSIITIQGMEFYAYHGCFEEERKIGTHFLVDVALTADTTEAERTDDLSKTVNYQSVYAVIKREMSISSKLLEHVAHRIMNAIAEEFPVNHIQLEIKKLNPPLGGKMRCVSVVLERDF